MPILLSHLSRIMSLLSQRPQRSLLSPIPPTGAPNPPIPCAAPHAIHPARPVADESCLPSAARTARPAQFSPLHHANRLGCPPNPAQSASPPHVPLGLTPAPDTTTAPLRGRLVSGAAGSVAGGGARVPRQRAILHPPPPNRPGTIDAQKEGALYSMKRGPACCRFYFFIWRLLALPRFLKLLKH